VVIEPGSELAAELWAMTRHRVASSILCYPEGRAALAAARRAGRLDAGGYDRALNDFEATQRELVVVGIDEPLARHAGDLAQDLRLRGYDAVHLATALALGSRTTLITWDKDLARAATETGCGVAPAPEPTRSA
jgi:predicted nucleic acid-binding protein